MNNRKACWWCGKVSSGKSGEHIIKKTDIKDAFGMPPYSYDSNPILSDGEKKRLVQGPNSKLVKWNSNLCRKCNNENSQLFDIAYSQFIENTKPLFLQILSTRKIDLEVIYKEFWKKDFTNLIKYIVKHVSCRLDQDLNYVPKNFIDFLNCDAPLFDLAINIEIRPLNEISRRITNYPILGLGELNSVNQSLISWLTTGFISFNYVIGSNINPGFESIESNILKVTSGRLNEPTNILDPYESISKKNERIDNFDRIGSDITLNNFYVNTIQNSI